ncbi:MobF family relaxase [Leptospirillum ferriphilum]|uniref:MobF family relaxase n=1 Tax=Leptospirillum ferriphilum TaxID=178606 RepID=UPI00098570ED|nr:MobF family relaxase [Leptospirillum ferriphilum]
MALGKNISPGQGETYYRKDDYYLEREGGEDHKLEWGGKLAAEMGLSGKASAEDWKNALNGHFPGGIEIKGGSFKDPETGELLKRAGTDFVIEAPKTVSMLYAATDNQELKGWIMKVQGEVEQLSFDYLESQIGARRGHDGKEWETTGKALYGHVRHMSNREGECFLHAHGVFLNITQNSDGKYQAMTNDRMMQYQRLVKEMGDAHWAKRLSEKGIGIDKGKYGEVQIADFSRDQIDFHSSRGQKIEEYIREKWGVGWSKLLREERNEKRWMREEAWERTRKAKKVHELEGLETRWKEEAKVSGADEATRKVEIQFEKGKTKYLSPEKRLEIARESLKFAIEHHTERESAVKEGELIRTALQAGRGKITFEDLKKAVAEAKAEGSLIRQEDDLAGRKQNLMTSREALEREKRILSYEKSGRGAVEPVMNPLQAEATLKAIQERDGLTLNNEQKAAARMILTTDNRYSGINGYAGTGKTTMLKPAIESLQNGAAVSALKNAGYEVIGLGPQHSAVHALKDAGIIESRTLQSWLADRQAGKDLTNKTVVVIDEAGLTNAKDMESAMKRIEKAGARAVLVGDIKQYESVAAGPAFALLQKKGMETVYVTEMQRQNKAEANVKEAAKLSIDAPAKALEKIEVREVRNPQERFRALSEEYLKSEDPKETLVLTGTHEARKAVNENIREALNLKGKGQEFTRYEAGDFTEAQKKRIDSYEKGQDVRFGKDYRGMGASAGEIGRVEGVDRENGTVRLKMEDGRNITMTPREMSGKGHEIGHVENLELAAGDRIRITGNELKKEGITNGMRGEVIELKHDSLKIHLDNGKDFDLKPGSRPVEIDHGYAQTGHSAQGLGAEKVIMDLPSNSQTLNQRSFYTNLTRTKGELMAFTDDREKLTGAVTREKDKTMAMDVEKESKEFEIRPTGEERGRSEEEKSLPIDQNREIRREQEEQKERTPGKENTLADNENRREDRDKDRSRETETSNGKEKTMERSEEKEYEHLTRQERERFDKWEEGQRLRFPQENKELGMKAGEVARVEKMDRETGVITLRKENGREAKLVPEHTKREMERQKSMEEEKSPERKSMEQGKEERKEEKKEATKEQDRSRGKDPFQERPEERPERKQEKEREEKKEAPRIERQRERGRDGMGY